MSAQLDFWWAQGKRAGLYLGVPALFILADSWCKAPKWHVSFWQFVHYHFIEFFTIELAVGGILYAVHHDFELGGQTARVKQQLEVLAQLEVAFDRQLKRVEESLSTRRIGQFKKYLEKIAELGQGASRLDILVDFLDYGSFFRPEEHESVHNAICGAARAIPVRLLVCGDPEPPVEPSDQSPSVVGDLSLYKAEDQKALVSNYVKALRKDRGFKAWLDRLRLQRRGDLSDFKAAWIKQKLPADMTLDQCIAVCSEPQIDNHDGVRAETIIKDFNEKVSLLIENRPLMVVLLQLRQLWFAEALQRANVDIRSLPNPEPLFFWLKYKDGLSETHHVDDGVFIFANAARGPSKLGYSTHDPEPSQFFL